MYTLIDGKLILKRAFPKKMSFATALKKSIEKWKYVVEHIKEITVDDGGARTCALCSKFLDRDSDTPCFNCPVYKTTGKEYCKETPYELIASIFDYDDKYSLEYKKLLANAELVFLQDIQKRK